MQDNSPNPKLPLPSENVFGHRKKLDFLRRQIGDYIASHPGRKIRILDAGCSNGQYVTIHLGDLNTEIIAVDPHKPSIEYARAHNPYPDTISFLVGTERDLPPEECFDIIVMADVLEHLENPGELLDSARNRLKNEGLILVSIPNRHGPFEMEKALDRKGCLIPAWWIFNLASATKKLLVSRRSAKREASKDIPYADECGHVQFWTLGNFNRLLTMHGLRITSFRKGSWLGTVYTSRWLDRSRIFCRWNAAVADYLPSCCVSTWYFKIEIDSQGRIGAPEP
jgi:2-polyprenyl-3-methyl-5-hydroxy-6-metoxy-1,4-benzoquinol methylase